MGNSVQWRGWAPLRPRQHAIMIDDIIADIEQYLMKQDADESGLDYLRRLGPDGLERLLRQIQADYNQAAQSLELSGRDVARITVLAHALAHAAGVTAGEGKETMVRLVEVGWMMARWYQGD